VFLSIVYDLYIPKQGNTYKCWLMAPAIISCKTNSEEEFKDVFSKKVGSLKNDYHFNNIDELFANGLSPGLLSQTYTYLGLKSQEASKILGRGTNTDIVNNIHSLLSNFGPFIMVRRALGADNWHSVAIVGVVIGDDKNPDRIIIFQADTMEGKPQAYSVDDFKDFIQIATTHLSEHDNFNLIWYFPENAQHISQISRMNATQINELYSNAICEIFPNQVKQYIPLNQNSNAIFAKSKSDGNLILSSSSSSSSSSLSTGFISAKKLGKNDEKIALLDANKQRNINNNDGCCQNGCCSIL
jgi:hypothetical protein